MLINYIANVSLHVCDIIRAPTNIKMTRIVSLEDFENSLALIVEFSRSCRDQRIIVVLIVVLMMWSNVGNIFYYHECLVRSFDHSPPLGVP